jgi:hypothetical protein
MKIGSENMKMYAWQPSGHGQYSFFVCAENEIEAKKAVDKYIADNLNKDNDEYLSDYSIRGWNTDYYTVTEVDPCTVISHSND